MAEAGHVMSSWVKSMGREGEVVLPGMSLLCPWFECEGVEGPGVC